MEERSVQSDAVAVGHDGPAAGRAVAQVLRGELAQEPADGRGGGGYSNRQLGNLLVALWVEEVHRAPYGPRVARLKGGGRLATVCRVPPILYPRITV